MSNLHPDRLDPAALTILLDQLAHLISQQVAAQLHAQPTGHHPGADADSPWMSITTAAAYVDWPKHRLYKLTAAGRIPHSKIDNRLLFHRDELDQWLQRFAQGARE